MRIANISHAALLLAPICVLICTSSHGYGSQSAATGAAAQSAPTNAAPATGSSPSALLTTSLDAVGKTLGGLALDRWKKGNVREEAATNIQSIQRDLQTTLPPLLALADASPRAASKVLPVSRNVDALYAVLLRVVDAARISAPDDQFNQLQSAMAGLDKARHALNDHIQEIAANQEKQAADLQVALKAQPVPVCPVAPTPTAAPAPAKKVVKKKPAAKPATKPASPASTAAPSPTAKPPQ